MKNIKKIFIVSFLILVLIYVTNITSIPSNIVLFQGESFQINTVLGINVQAKENNYETVQASTEVLSSTSKIGKIDYKLNLFGGIPLKDITVNVIPKTSVVPLGNTVGLKLYTSGVLVVGMSEIEGLDNNKYKPYENTGIREGDMLIEANGDTLTCTSDLLNTVNESKGNNVFIKYVREGEVLTTSITPIRASDNKYKLGLWVRDAAAGVGTVSFYEPSTNTFAALGHGIQDVDTRETIKYCKRRFCYH